jgi:hypothetical protein
MGTMTDQERRHLIQADRHIAECKDRITRQRDFIEQLRAGGHDTAWHNPCSTALETGLNAFETHRQLILDRLKDSERDERKK